MFDAKFFDDWLDSQAQKVMEKVASDEGIAPEQMMINAQSSDEPLCAFGCRFAK